MTDEKYEMLKEELQGICIETERFCIRHFMDKDEEREYYSLYFH